MKKLFVLFLLVALVPFTVGCGLFGDNDDTSPVDLPILRASLSSYPVPASLRADAAGLAYVNSKNVTMTINGIELKPSDATEVGSADPREFNINFSAFVTDTAKYNQIISGSDPIEVIVKTSAGTEIIQITPTQALTTGTLSLVVDATTGKIDTTKVTVDAVKVPAAPKDAVALDYTVKNGDVDVATTKDTAKEVVQLPPHTPAFVVTLLNDKELNVDKVVHSIKVRNANGKAAVALPEGSFSLGQQTGLLNSVTITVVETATAKLVGGQTYEVEIVGLSDGTNLLKSKTFYFIAR
ncbi:MAG TPA: hypothetical protein PLK28_03555 [Candidatus Rifleibacterium sp.]|nr:hypothetical protein [Candidatus Rifleibacterium sp.]